MIDAEIELVVHPGGFDAGEQRAGLLDQVVVIEQAAAVLLGAKAGNDGARDGDERSGAVARHGGAPPDHECAQAPLLGQEALRQERVSVAHRLADDALARLALDGAKNRAVRLETLGARERLQLAKAVALLDIAPAALRQRGDDRRPLGRGNQRIGEELRLDGERRLVGSEAERVGELGDGSVDAAGPIDPGHQAAALADRLAQDVAKGLIGGRADDARERAPERAVGLGRSLQQGIEGEPIEQLRFRCLVEHRKARRDIGLERKLLQQPRAEGMDGLHLEAARRVQRLREQPARAGAALPLRPLVGHGMDGGIELVVGERGPACQRVEHAGRHIGGRRLGEGEAENLGRRRAAEQEADHALRQHIGLARARIGGDPGRLRRIGGRALAFQHLGGISGAAVIARLRLLAHPAAQRPFLDARQMVVIAVAAALEHRPLARPIGRRRILESARHLGELL